jgi:hypothetical protein
MSKMAGEFSLSVPSVTCCRACKRDKQRLGLPGFEKFHPDNQPFFC